MIQQLNNNITKYSYSLYMKDAKYYSLYKQYLMEGIAKVDIKTNIHFGLGFLIRGKVTIHDLIMCYLTSYKL